MPDLVQRPTLRQLEYFVALAEHLHFRVAAEACSVTQPGLSGQIAQLESLLGLTLFERDKRQVRLSRAGEALLPEARETLAHADALLERARSLGEPLTGPLRLGVIPTVGPYLLPKVLPAVRAEFPELRLYLREDMTARLLEQLAAGELELLALALDVGLGDVETLPLFSDPFLVGLPADDELAERESLGLADLADRDVLLLDEGHCLRSHTLPLCESSGAREAAGFRASSLGTLTQMVAEGLGITLLPEMARERECAATPGMVVVPFDADGPGRRIGLAWRRSSPRAPEYRQLAATLTRAWANG